MNKTFEATGIFEFPMVQDKALSHYAKNNPALKAAQKSTEGDRLQALQ